MEDNQNNNIIDDDEVIPLAFLEKLHNLPKNPGVYIFKNTSGKIIYIGKAINLRNRVKSYFHKKGPVEAKTKALIKKITDVEVFVTDYEAEALILEDTLIKQHKPRYNIMLRDDKTYPYVRVTNEPFPKIFTTRKIIRDGSKYFGPFTEVYYLRKLMKLIRTIFFIRSCDLKLTLDNINKNKFKVCLDFHIKKCEGPCEGLVSSLQYTENVKAAIQIINGKTHELEKMFEKEMNSLSEQLRFEEAAIMKNRYILLRDFSNSQKIVSVDLVDRDIIGMARVDDLACSLILIIRDGKLTGKRHFIINNAFLMNDEEIIQTTLEQWYFENEFIPKEIYLPVLPEQPEFFYDWLKRKRGKSIELFVPKLGDKKKMISMAAANAEFLLREYILALAKKENTASRSVLALQRDLRMDKPPLRIECFDNSHIQGSDYVSSMVVFIDGKPQKSDYRKYKINTFTGNDDFAAMREVIQRRYSRLLSESQSHPDLIIVDGGKGQLSSAIEVLKSAGLFPGIPIIGLAKRLEEVFIPNESEPIILPRTSSSLRLLQQIRDEAHRFAITFHRQLRSKRTITTELMNITGIGTKTAQKLLVKFGSVIKLKEAGFEAISAEVGDKAAQKIIEYFYSINNEKNI